MVFERLAQHFEGLLVEFRQLVGKKNAVVSQRNLARLGVRATADKRNFADGMMWRAERTL